MIRIYLGKGKYALIAEVDWDLCQQMKPRMRTSRQQRNTTENLQVTDLKITKGNFSVHLLKDSICLGKRLMTWLLTYNRTEHSEVMTHRGFARNAASSRAIPFTFMQEWIARDPALPVYLGQNQSGMQSGAAVVDQEGCYRDLLLRWEDTARWQREMMAKYNLHKETINRYSEAWSWITVMTTMDWEMFSNFISLRCTKFAHPNIQRLAINMARVALKSQPQELQPGDWHIPFLEGEILSGAHTEPRVKEALTWATARAAWCSYNLPEKVADFPDAVKRHDSCIDLLHVTPTEHPARANGSQEREGKIFCGYDNYRMMIPNEHIVDVDLKSIVDSYGDRDYLTV